MQIGGSGTRLSITQCRFMQYSRKSILMKARLDPVLPPASKNPEGLYTPRFFAS